MRKNYVLYLIAPCYNEEKVLPLTYSLFVDKLNELIKKKRISEKSRVVFVNDGSSDDTWNIISSLAKKNKLIEGISLSRNRGHQNALLAGLMECKDLCDVTITLDCDGQHDLKTVDDMLDEYENGSEIVYAVRQDRTGDNALKSLFSNMYYKLIKVLGADIIDNHADYRLVSSRALNEFKDFREVHVFLRGLFPLVGFKSSIVKYEQHERTAGKSHYSISKMFTLAIDGITSMSIKPIRLIFGFGVIVSIVFFIMMIVSLINRDELWFACSIISLLFGIVLISLGIVGEYVGKTYMESKHRPRYIISEKTYK